MTTIKKSKTSITRWEAPYPENIYYPRFNINDKVPPPDFILPGFETGQVGLVFAPRSTDKSFLLLELALSVASGEVILPSLSPSTSGLVKGLFFEMNDRNIRNHMSSIFRQFPSGESGLGRLFLFPLLGERLSLLDCDGEVIPEAVKWLYHQCEGMRLLILDPLNLCHRAKENNNRAMNNLIWTLIKIGHDTGTGILVTYHVPKVSVVDNNIQTQQINGGASILADGARLVFSLEENSLNTFLVWKSVKISEHAPLSPVFLRRSTSGVLVARDV